MKTITLYVDPDTCDTSVVVPPPAGGLIKLVQIIDAGGKIHHILRFRDATPEQIAHHIFWAEGTSDRITSIVADAKKGSVGITRTLRWLVEVRIREAYQKTGYLYRLEVVKSLPPKEADEHRGSATGEGPGWLYDPARREFLKPASYEQAERFRATGVIFDAPKGVSPVRYILRYPKKGEPVYVR